jgi:hypothetical protein
MLALVATAIMDSDRNPTGLDAPYPHYWIYHLYWFPLTLAAIGVIGVFITNFGLEMRERLALIAFSLIALGFIANLILEARFVIMSRGITGGIALTLVAPFYLTLLWLLSRRSARPK